MLPGLKLVIISLCIFMTNHHEALNIHTSYLKNKNESKMTTKKRLASFMETLRNPQAFRSLRRDLCVALHATCGSASLSHRVRPNRPFLGGASLWWAAFTMPGSWGYFAVLFPFQFKWWHNFFSKVNKTEPLSNKGDGKTLLSPSFWFYKNLILKLEGICWFPPCSFQGLHGVFNLISCHMRKVLGNLYPFETSLKHLM